MQHRQKFVSGGTHVPFASMLSVIGTVWEAQTCDFSGTEAIGQFRDFPSLHFNFAVSHRKIRLAITAALVLAIFC